MLINKIIAAGLVALSALVAAVPAQAKSSGTQANFTIQFGAPAPAQFRGHPGRWGLMSPGQVQWELQRQGFRHIRFTNTHGPVYRALAVSPRGGRVAIVVSARSGHILNVDRIGPRHHRHHRGGRGYY